MLANGAKLGYSPDNSGSTYKDLPGLKEVPDIGAEPEKVDNTCLADRNKVYERGIGDLGEMAYKFKFDNSSAETSYRILKGLEKAGKAVKFEQLLIDGTKIHYEAIPSIKIGGGGVNATIDFTVTMTVQSTIDIVDPD